MAREWRFQFTVRSIWCSGYALCPGAGSGIGVAVAFSAPIGGLLFAFEEVASGFATSLWCQIFFGCMLSVLSLDTLRSAQRAMTKGRISSFKAKSWCAHKYRNL